MYTKLTGEFDSVEFAETAARRIRERVNGQKKIVIYNNKNKYRGCASPTEYAISAENSMIMFPFSTHSNNFITGMTARKVGPDSVNELLLTKSVKMDVVCETLNKEKALQYMISCGGYDIH